MSNIDLSLLAKPFQPREINFRVGAMTKDKTKAIALGYLDARDVMVRLDAVAGLPNWQCRYEHISDTKTCCSIAIRIGDDWVWKSNGAGDSDIEAEKGAFSDAFKRAAVLWGIGRYLYSMPNKWYAIDEWKKFTPDSVKQIKSDYVSWAISLNKPEQ